MLDHPLEIFVRKLNSHVQLNDDDRAAILALPYTLSELKPDEYILREGDVPTVCAILLHGFAIRQKLDMQGSRQIVGIQIPGDALDVQHLFLDCADHDVQALSRSSIAIIPKKAMQQIASARPIIAQALAISVQIDASIAREWLLNIGKRDARRRLAHLFCEVAVRLEQQQLTPVSGYELPMTQEQLGDTLGLTSVHVNRTLRRLEEAGLIARVGRAVRFVEALRLEEFAGFNRNYLHLTQQKARARSRE